MFQTANSICVCYISADSWLTPDRNDLPVLRYFLGELTRLQNVYKNLILLARCELKLTALVCSNLPAGSVPERGEELYSLINSNIANTTKMNEASN